MGPHRQAEIFTGITQIYLFRHSTDQPECYIKSIEQEFADAVEVDSQAQIGLRLRS